MRGREFRTLTVPSKSVYYLRPILPWCRRLRFVSALPVRNSHSPRTDSSHLPHRPSPSHFDSDLGPDLPLAPHQRFPPRFQKRKKKKNKQFGVTINASLESSVAGSMQFWCRLGDPDHCLHCVVISVADLEVKFNFPTAASTLPCGDKPTKKQATAASTSHFLLRRDRI